MDLARNSTQDRPDERSGSQKFSYFWAVGEHSFFSPACPAGECLQVAYDDIKDRKGKMVDGVFIKEE